MSAVLTNPTIEIERRVVLHGVSWPTYELLMKDHEDRSAPRFVYDDGELEIYQPSMGHERISRFFEVFVGYFVAENDLDLRSFGSTTFKSERRRKGVEPDCCFYLQHVEDIRDTEKLDLTTYPPPDLVVEVDITSPSISRFPIYAGFGVPEIWRYFREGIKIYVLANGAYLETETSHALPPVTSQVLLRFLRESQTEKHSVWLKKLRAWVRENCRPQDN